MQNSTTPITLFPFFFFFLYYGTFYLFIVLSPARLEAPQEQIFVVVYCCIPGTKCAWHALGGAQKTFVKLMNSLNFFQIL